ncbi:hypothetical protein K7432_017016 [Basidiobolus ranarum]|uniref:Phosphodiester glycosidase domain-containing protein n=1 Tax=Basidiobolus ranarum TaxID=34480 RepID=A0ABR2WDY5_9FUNG
MSQAGIFKDDYHSSTVIICDIHTVDVASVGSNTVAQSGKYGINAGFFDSGVLLSIACSSGGLSVYTGGHRNAKTRGTMVCYKLPDGNFGVEVPVIGLFSEFKKPENSSIQWAVGGYSLHLESTDTPEIFMNKLQESEKTQGISNVFQGGFSHRSAIGYRREDKKIVLASFYCSSVLEVRNVLKNAYKCDIAIMLDGGGSSQISGVEPSLISSRNPRGIYHENYSNGNRGIYSMVTVNSSKWGDVRSLIKSTTESKTMSRSC